MRGVISNRDVLWLSDFSYINSLYDDDNGNESEKEDGEENDRAPVGDVRALWGNGVTFSLVGAACMSSITIHHSYLHPNSHANVHTIRASRTHTHSRVYTFLFYTPPKPVCEGQRTFRLMCFILLEAVNCK